MPAMDYAFAARLEKGMAAANLRILSALRLADPPLATDALVLDGATAPYCPGTPMGEAVGLGMSGPVEEETLDQVEQFYAAHGRPTSIRVCSLADPSLIKLTAARGYRLTSFGHRWILDLSAWKSPLDGPDARVRAAGREEETAWAWTLERGFSSAEELDLTYARALFRMDGGIPAMALEGGEPAAAGMLDLDGGIGALFATGTRREFRRRGLQTALLDWRLREARARGATLASIETDPGSPSQRNVERMGFRLAYTSASLQRPLDP